MVSQIRSAISRVEPCFDAYATSTTPSMNGTSSLSYRQRRGARRTLHQ
jgi:hypothetical protein